MRWVVERGVFASGFDLTDAARAAGHRVISWRDDAPPAPSAEPTLFHGSLGVAARLAADRTWRPGSFCDVGALSCSAWYPRAARWLLNADWQLLPAEVLVADPPLDRMFVRPDSPLKPFSGRVVSRAGLTLAALDFGFYYDDPALPVIVAPVRAVEREWRYVVAAGEVVAGSAYQADGRAALPDDPGGAPWRYAAAIAAELAPPEPMYVLDIGWAEGALRLVELNPFSGADLYGCDPAAIVAAADQLTGSAP